jgi:hypothetical protein
VDKSRVAVGAGAGSSCCCLWASFIITCRYAAGVECRPLAHTLARRKQIRDIRRARAYRLIQIRLPSGTHTNTLMPDR